MLTTASALRESNSCVLNGRFDPLKNNFTSISVRGKSVVDYIITSNSLLHLINDFHVYTMSDLLLTYGLESLIGERSRPPDHSFVYSSVNTSQYNVLQCSHTVESVYTSTHVATTPVKFCLRNIPDVFMNNINWNLNVSTVCDKLNFHMQEGITLDELNDTYEVLCDATRLEMSTYLSKRSPYKGKGRSRPYWNNTLSELYKWAKDRERDFLACKRRGRANAQLYSQLMSIYKSAQMVFDRALRNAERQYNRNRIIKIDDLCNKNPTEFWKCIKKLGPSKNTKIPQIVKNKNNVIVNELEQVLGEWKQAFCGLMNVPDIVNDVYYSELVYIYHLSETYVSIDNNHVINRNVSLYELRAAARRLKANKAVGCDNIPNEIIKLPAMENVLVRLFNVCLSKGVVPAIWRKSIISPIPKDKNKDQLIPLNYRGISLLSTLSKLFTSIINTRLAEYLSSKHILVDEQNGFRKHRSCTDHLFVLNSAIRNRLNINKNSFVAFVDMEKAFDRVDRRLLFFRLQQYGINGRIYEIIKAIYTGNKSSVKVNDNMTDWYDVNCGVRQGDILSPLLFNLYINDLVVTIKKLNLGIAMGNLTLGVLLYADDLAILAENESDLQIMLNTLYTWCEKWKLRVNINKTNVIHFRAIRFPRSTVEIKYGECDVLYTSQYKYLGIYVDEYLKYDIGIKNLSDAGQRALGSIIGKCKQLKDFSYRTFTKLYETCVNPVLNYSSAVWGYKSRDCINKVYFSAIRYFWGVHKFCPILALQGEMGWKLPVDWQQINMIIYWNHLCSMSDDRLTKKVFLYDYSICDRNWCAEVKNIMSRVDMMETFQNCVLCIVSKFSKSFR